MKISLAISALILLVAANFGWQDHRHLVAARGKHARLVAEARKSGVSADAGDLAGGGRVTKHGRENRETEAKLAAADFIRFAKEMEAVEKKGGPPDEAMRQRIMDFMDRMTSLDAGQLKILIAEVRADKTLKDETRRGLIGFSIMTMASDHPQAALALFTESSDLFQDDGMGNQVVSSSLAKWAKDDPMAALEWVRKNGEKYPDVVNEGAKRGLISGAAAQDPRLALQLMGELGLKDSENAISSIINAAKTPGDRTATLAALREHLAKIPDEKDRTEAAERAIGLFGYSVSGDGFESGTRWLKGAGFSPDELVKFADSLNHNLKGGETGQWIGWFGENLPEEKSRKPVGELVRRWTQNDYRAAGEWIASVPGGATRNTAVRSYAETVSRYEPESAAQWAMTLPPGEDRDKTLKRIHENWPKNDAASKQAAEAFAKAHGIE